MEEKHYIITNKHEIIGNDITVSELIEFLKQFPSNMKCSYDYGLGLEVEYLEDLNVIDFH